MKDWRSKRYAAQKLFILSLVRFRKAISMKSDKIANQRREKEISTDNDNLLQIRENLLRRVVATP